MAIKKTTAGWLVDSQPGGRGAKRFRKTFATQAEAKAFDAWLHTQLLTKPEWQPAKRDSRKLSELFDLWLMHHGSGLRAGADTHRRLLAVAKALGDPLASQFTVDMFAQYRTKRLSLGVSANNLNREHS